ncbi:MAG: hypothetical protein RQ739_05225 [Desulfotignum sp.]|nr:hypothetical protein [Desulfotignum sp.]
MIGRQNYGSFIAEVWAGRMAIRPAGVVLIGFNVRRATGNQPGV